MIFPSFLHTPLRCLAAALLWGLFGLSASARQTDVLRRVLLSHWGIAPHNFSGIAPLGNDRYVVVSDKDTAAGFYVWHIEQDSVTGQVVRVTDEGFRPHAVSAGAPQPDYEGVAYESARARVWIADEATQQIRAFAHSGQPTGDSLCIPAAVSASAIRPNRGFEALTFSPTDSLLWTASEEPPRADPPSVAVAGEEEPATGGVIELLGFSAAPRPVCHRALGTFGHSARPAQWRPGAVRPARREPVGARTRTPRPPPLSRQLVCGAPVPRVGPRHGSRRNVDPLTGAQAVADALDHAFALFSLRSGQLRRTLSGASVARRPPNAVVRERCAGWGRALVPAYARRLARHRLAIGCRRGRCPMSERTGQGS